VTITQGPSIEIEKSTNGQDADSAPGPSLTVGDPITWTYVVTNTGNVTLTNIVVTDSVLGAVGTITSLASGASQTLTKTGTAVAGQYENIGSATGKDPLQNDVSDNDYSHYLGAVARIELTPGFATNKINDPHTITATVEVDTGGGFGPAPNGTVVDFTITGAATFVSNGLKTITGTISNGLGTVTVTLNSSTIGSNTISATAKLAGHTNVTRSM